MLFLESLNAGKIEDIVENLGVVLTSFNERIVKVINVMKDALSSVKVIVNRITKENFSY